MKSLAITMWSIIGIAGAQAATPSACSSVLCVLHGAPAPSIGAGVPVALVIGGVLLGMRLLKSWRQS
jgi:hypothetical protein